jgi:uncharacterized membrane protein
LTTGGRERSAVPAPLAPREAWRRFRLLAPVCVALLALGYSRTAPGTARTTPWGYRSWAFDALAYSDVIALHADRGAGRHRFPYIEDRIEYPVLLGVGMWLPSLVAPGAAAYFALTYAALALCALAALWFLCALPGTKPWVLAASPALVVYAGLSWDLYGIALLLLGAWLWARDRERWAAIVLGLAVWTKLFPLVLLVLLLLTAWRRGLRHALELAALAAAVSLAVNLPFAFAGSTCRENWLWFFRYSSIREIEPSLYLLFGADRRGFVPRANVTCFIATLAGMAVVAALELRTRRLDPLSAVTALTCLFFVANKVFSPQYWLWVVALLALAGAPAWLAIATGTTALVDYGVSFHALHLIDKRAWAQWQWFHQSVFVPALWLRYVTLCACCGWAAAHLLRPVFLRGSVPR